jgi:poly(hydroxyalkanoate) granule-associated protein
MAPKDKPKRSKAAPSFEADKPTPPAQHIWLAGLGAMAKAQEQGNKAIEALVNEGLAFQRKSQTQAQQRLHEATERLSHMAADFGQQATGRVDKLEHLFEDRVAKALQRLGMPTLLDVQMLTDRVAQLESKLAAQLDAQRDSQLTAPLKAPGTSAVKASAKTAARPAAQVSAQVPAKKTRSKLA